MGFSGLHPFHTSTLYRICYLQGTLYPTLHGSIAPYILPCTLYPIPCPIQVYSTLHYTLYPIPCTLVYIGMWYPVPCTLVYTRKKPDTSDDASGGRYRTKKSPAGIESCRACSERRVVTYSKVGLDVSAPRIPAIVIVTSPINIEPNDCTAVKSSLPA